MPTDINYPIEHLPLPVKDGYSMSHQSPLQRSQLDSGRARQRRRFTSVPTYVQVKFFFETDAQAQYFEIFFRSVLKDGAEWFNMPLRTPMTKTYQLYEARFTDIYSNMQLEGGEYWSWTAEIEIRDRQTLPTGWAEFPQFVVGSDIIDLAINREWPQ